MPEAFPAEKDVLHLPSYFREIGHAAGASGHQLLNLLIGESMFLGRVDPYSKVLHPFEAHFFDASVVVHEVAGGLDLFEAAKAHFLKEGYYLRLKAGAPARQFHRDRGGPLFWGDFAQTLTVDAVDGEEAGVAEDNSAIGLVEGRVEGVDGFGAAGTFLEEGAEVPIVAA